MSAAALRLAGTPVEGESGGTDAPSPASFVCRVVGDTMAPDFNDGDVVVFDPTRRVCDGQACFVVVANDDGSDFRTFKRVRFLWEPGNTLTVRLEPINPAHHATEHPSAKVLGLYAAASVTRTITQQS
jgi:SOS-response transcriptional repressor LexA